MFDLVLTRFGSESRKRTMKSAGMDTQPSSREALNAAGKDAEPSDESRVRVTRDAIRSIGETYVDRLIPWLGPATFGWP